jgi:pimeloyl-ACP methyl ester carboxylesterase
MPETTTFAIRDQKQDQALVLVHGFSGNSHETFGLLPAFLAGNPSLYGWDIHSFGYPTSLKPDISGVWTADPDLTALAGYLATAIDMLGFARYQRLCLIAHSMGGLVVQRAVLDGGFGNRLSHVFLFGTPSNGLRKAGLGRIFKRQARDMMRDGPFVTKVRADWTARFGNGSKFAFRAVAGLRDEFVPRESSVDLFDKSLRAYISGDHLEMVKPATLDGDIVQLLLRLLSAPASAPSPSPHQKVIDELLPKRTALNEENIRRLVFALEAVGRQDEAIAILDEVHTRSTDLTGIYAGRLKRRWLADPDVRHTDGVRARDLYASAYSAADTAGDHPQAYYNGINTAFMVLALDQDRERARKVAASVLVHTSSGKPDSWARATQGEAYLYLGDTRAALAAYADAARQTWESRELDSMQRQAIWAARLTDNAVAEMELEALFKTRLGQ